MAVPASAVLQAVTAAFNTVSSAIKAQAAVLAGQLSVNQQGTEYHQQVDYSLFSYANAAQQQRTIVVSVLVIGSIIFLLVILFR